MIAEIQDAIVARLEEIAPPARGDVAAWTGDPEELLSRPTRPGPPALWVIYQGADFEGRKVIGGAQARLDMDWLIVLAAHDLKSRNQGAETAYALIEAVRNKLKGWAAAGYGWLWPVKEDLIAAQGGTLVYGLQYRLNNVTIS
ncbi:MAG: Gp37 family protein [Thermodesulfobacteriota bacterium]